MSRPTPPDLAHLRHLVHSDPSPEVWSALRQQLRPLQGEALALALEYVSGHVAEWPYNVRFHRSYGVLHWLNTPPWWRLVGHLSFEDTDVGPRGMAMLAASDRLNAVSRLTFDNSRLGAAGAQALAQARDLPALLDLDLGAPLGPDAIDALAQAPWFGQLVRLNLARSSVHDTVATLFQAPDAHIQHLQLPTLSPTALASLGQAPGLAKVTHLALGRIGSHTAEGDGDCWGAFLSSPHLSALEHLDLRYCRPGHGITRALASATRLERLEHLHLWGVHLTTEDAPTGRYTPPEPPTHAQHQPQRPRRRGRRPPPTLAAPHPHRVAPHMSLRLTSSHTTQQHRDGVAPTHTL